MPGEREKRAIEEAQRLARKIDRDTRTGPDPVSIEVDTDARTVEVDGGMMVQAWIFVEDK